RLCQTKYQPSLYERIGLWRGIVMTHVLARYIHHDEPGRIPQLVAKVAIAVAAVEIEIESPIERRERRKREPQRVGAERWDSRRILLARSLGDRFRLARIHQVRRLLGDERIDVDAIDQIERIEHVAFRLGHLAALLVPDDRIDVDVVKRYATQKIRRHHDHPRDPEADDVEAGDERRRWPERSQLPRV